MAESNPQKLKAPRKIFRSHQVALALNQAEVATLLQAIRGGYILSGKTTDDLTDKLHNALISADRDPDKFGFPGEQCTSGICKPPKFGGTLPEESRPRK